MRTRALAVATALSIALTPAAAFTVPAVAKTKPPTTTHHTTKHHAKKHKKTHHSTTMKKRATTKAGKK